MKKINTNFYKTLMGNFATGVTIVSINHNNNYIGKTVNSFSSLSLKPPLVLFSLDKKSSSLKNYLSSKYIGINILSKKQKKLSQYFSSNSPTWNIEKNFLSKNNTPLIKGSLVNLDCKKIKTINMGDHVILICEILTAKTSNRIKPLIYFKSKYLK